MSPSDWTDFFIYLLLSLLLLSENFGQFILMSFSNLQYKQKKDKNCLMWSVGKIGI